MIRYIVSFAGNSIAIEYDCSEAQEIVDFLYRDVRPNNSSAPHVTLRLEKRDDALLMFHEKEFLYQNTIKGGVANHLIGETIHHLIDKNARGMALHAGCISSNGKGILLPGQSGAGKSSLTAWLTTKGCNYLTDEYAFIQDKSNFIETFTRPINIKKKGLTAMRELVDIDASADETMDGPLTVLISHRLLNPSHQPETPPLQLIIFPDYREGTEFELTPVPKAEAGMCLMGCLVNARNLVGHGFEEAARLTREVPAYRLTYSNFSQLDSNLDRILP